MTGSGSTGPSSLRTRWTERVDALLGPRFRGRDADELRRARLIISTNLLLATCSVAIVGLLIVFGWGASFVPSSMGAGAILAANAWMMRRTGRHDLAALTLCVVMLAAIATASWVQGGLSNRVVTWTLLVAMFAPMLMGLRYALIGVGLVIAHVVTLYVAERSGHVFPELAHSSSRIVGSQILMTVFVSGFAWLWERSRREALAARDIALASLEESREARVAGGVVEIVQLEEMIAAALQISSGSFERHAIEVISEVATLPALLLDRHKLIGILTNFIANSRQALNATAIDRKRILVRAFCNEHGKLQIDVVDNGAGIAPEHVDRLFSYGFTPSETATASALRAACSPRARSAEWRAATAPGPVPARHSRSSSRSSP